jgi:predicted HTH domain antitoxin
MSTTNANQASHQEGRILLAIQALEKDQISSVQAAARMYEVPRTSLVEQLHGRITPKDSQLKNQKLSPTEESVCYGLGRTDPEPPAMRSLWAMRLL